MSVDMCRYYVSIDVIDLSILISMPRSSYQKLKILRDAAVISNILIIQWKKMAITLWNLIEASILCLNAICVLHEERFLAKG